MRRWIVFAAPLIVVSSASPSILRAHEGHAPLPTRGATFDAKSGTLTLSREARDALDVQTAEVSRRTFGDSFHAYATLTAPWKAHAFVSSLLPGKIVRLHVKPGQRVKAGQVLAEVDSLELQALQLELLAAKTESDLSAQLQKQMEATGSGGVIAGNRIREARTKAKQDRNALIIAKHKWASLDLSSRELETLLEGNNATGQTLLPIRSPIAGTVIHADLAVGRIVDPKEHLFEVVDLTTVWARIGVLEKDLRRVAVDQPISLVLSSRPDELVPAKVAVVGQSLDPRSHVGAAWAELDNPPDGQPQYLPGMTGKVSLNPRDSGSRLAVPVDAVRRDGAERYVLVEESATKAGSQYRKQSVALGRRDRRWIEVSAGALLPGDRVVTRGGHELAHFFVQGVLRLTEETARDIRLQLEPATSRTIDDVISVDGTVDVPPDRRIVAASPLSGVLHRIHVDRAQAVARGDLLAEVLSLELQQMQLELLQAHLDSELQTDILSNIELAGDAVTKRRVLEVRAAATTAQMKQRSLRQRLHTVGLSSEQIDGIVEEGRLVPALPIRAPLDGVIVDFDKVLGHVVRADEALFTIHDLSQVWIQAHVPQRDAARLKIGAKARVRLVADDGFLAEGTIVRSQQTLGETSRTLAAWIELGDSAAGSLPHNLLARVTLVTASYAVPLAVPISATYREGSRAFVFVQKPDGSLERRLVTTGRADDRYVEITGGLRRGDPVAVRGVSELRAGYAAVR